MDAIANATSNSPYSLAYTYNATLKEAPGFVIPVKKSFNECANPA